MPDGEGSEFKSLSVPGVACLGWPACLGWLAWGGVPAWGGLPGVEPARQGPACVKFLNLSQII